MVANNRETTAGGRRERGPWAKGQSGNPSGRPKGRPNKTTALLKDAILLAGELSGADGDGLDGLVGYLRWLAATQPVAFASLLGKVLPLQVTGADGKDLLPTVIVHKVEL